MTELIKGNYVTVYCEKKYSYIVDNILTYYDVEEYSNTCVYVMLYKIDWDVCEKFDNIIFYNVEHLYCYGEQYFGYFRSLIPWCISENKITEFWDFDILNYKIITETFPELIKYYKFKPFRYVNRKKVDNYSNKKFTAIQIGVTRTISPYRDKILYNLNEQNYNKHSDPYIENFSIISIEKSKYSLEELYDEINLCKLVLNIPRIQRTGQEQVRIGELLSMNCNVATVTNGISYLSDFVHEVDYFAEDIVQQLQRMSPIENVADRFKDETEDEEDYKNYIKQCYNKWYASDNSYFFTIVIASIKGESLEETIASIRHNNMFERLQIIVVDIAKDSSVEDVYNNEYKGYPNIYYIKSDKSSLEHAYNIGLQVGIGKYICFINSSETYNQLYFDNVKQYLDTNECSIYISPYTRAGYTMGLCFESLGIGPILYCCVFKRECINITFDEDIFCSGIIFSGILCKQHKYIYRGEDVAEWQTLGWDESLDNDLKYLDMKEEPNNFNWIKYTQDKINEYNG